MQIQIYRRSPLISADYFDPAPQLLLLLLLLLPPTISFGLQLSSSDSFLWLCGLHSDRTDCLTPGAPLSASNR